jgi:hypothetical protein
MIRGKGSAENRSHELAGRSRVALRSRMYKILCWKSIAYRGFWRVGQPCHRADFKKPDRRKSSRPEDRRVHPRFIFFADCELTDRSNGSHYETRVTEISLGGCFVDLSVAIAQGTGLHIRVRKDGQIFDTEGIAAYIYPSMGIGIRFVNVSSESQEVLNGWIESLTR